MLEVASTVLDESFFVRHKPMFPQLFTTSDVDPVELK